MAHGGSAEWNAAVEQAVAPLRAERPVAVAYGMADRSSLQAAIAELETRGVTRISVVRLFLYRDSFLHQTEYLLGLRPDPPAQFLDHAHHAGHGHDVDSSAAAHASHGHGTAPHVQPTEGPLTGAADAEAAPSRTPVRRAAAIAVSRAGLLDGRLAGEILRERARELSRGPSRESVLLLAHGAGDDGENQDVLDRLEACAALLRQDAPYAAVRGETLREDWPGPRAMAERRIRMFVERERQAGRRVLVLPVRLSGFGEYHEVLEGLEYDADERGLLPHPAVTDWIRARLAEIE